jgi:hypothetical protein
MRAIIRFSVDYEINSALRNKLTPILETAGFQRGENTATYEHQNISQGNLGGALQNFWSTANAHGGPGRIDHFWMYSDRNPLDDLDPGGVRVIHFGG